MKNIFIFLFTFFIFLNPAFADIKDDIKKIQQEQLEELKQQEQLENGVEEQKLVVELTPEQQARINSYKREIANLESQLEDNILLKRYSNYTAYIDIAEELRKSEQELKKLNESNIDQYYKLENKIRIKKNELELISEYKESPIGTLINPPEIEVYEEITNPFGIINALSYKQKLKDHKRDFESIETEVSTLLSILNKKILAYLELYNLEPEAQYEEIITFLDNQKKDFLTVQEIVKTTSEVYNRKIEQVILETDNQIAEQITKTSIILAIIATAFILAFLIKFTLKKYFSQNENFYMLNKIINFVLVFLVVMIILFSYIENVSYVITILGFASAGIAIALKDWFMSIFGWMVIVTSGSIQVGDRIKVHRQDQEVVGDVLDISLFKITIREDVTYTSYTVNRRTGRIFFIPNNYVFSEMISNYTHAGLRTVWDGIDFTITFDSNYKKAQHIAKEILKHYSKGYTDITRKQLSKMRNKYALRATGVEPRVFTFVEPHGIVISCWYLTNSYAALVLRSTMSPEILNAFMKEDDINIAYPTQQININKTDTHYGPSRKGPPPADIEDEIIRR